MKLLLAVALLVLVPVQWENRCVSGSESILCREEERSALLQINAALPVPIQSSDGKWEGKECCQWERVTCDPNTGHITKLDLSADAMLLQGTILLNASMFLPLRQLRSLSLSRRSISGCMVGAGLEIWSNLTKLEILDLSANYVEISIIYGLASVSSLRTLDLQSGISDLPINGFESWSNLTKLEMLDLSLNGLPTSIFSSLAHVSSLRALFLDYNNMEGNFPAKELSALNLEVLSLSGCLLSGSIPYLGHWSSLKALSLEDNSLNGNLTSAGVEAQFGTFGNSSYEGNPNLCGPPLSKSCVPTIGTTLPSPNEMSDDQSYEGTDFLILFGSFSLFFVVSFWGFMAILYFKRNWRYALFTLVDRYADMIYVKVVLSVRKIVVFITQRGN